jgi:hypothetical protein
MNRMRAPREEDRVPERCSSSVRSTCYQPMVVHRMNETSQFDVLDLVLANQRLLERLEAKNARLRDSVAELMLQIQALREALGHARSETDPK